MRKRLEASLYALAVWVPLAIACADKGSIDQGQLDAQGISGSSSSAPAASKCGDGKVDPGEDCEPPGTANCDSSCLNASGCGDGVQQDGEECDDGNRVSGDGCSDHCLSEGCGNGRLDPGETCEQPNQPGCTAECQLLDLASCGDGMLQSGEQCEDGNTANGDGCSQQCQLEMCGNGRVDEGEQCEPPGSEHCGSNCQVPPSTNPGCGDGQLQAGEECEDGNTVAGDGCSPVCLIEKCGNGRSDPGEQCEPPGTALCDARCMTVVAHTKCGDGALDQGEACDDGNVQDGDGCNHLCQIEACGNSRLDRGEECDPPKAGSCSPACRLISAKCGNGVLDPGEACEDGNLLDGDGCSHACQPEFCGNGRLDPGEDCEMPGTASCDARCHSVSATCGNGKKEGSEECDDGNLIFGDGCNERCQAEICGNGRLDNTLECEPPGTSSCDARCRKLASAACGDGRIDTALGEECEDGNNVSGDGCSATCQREECGNGRLDWHEECEPPATPSCDARCRLKVRPTTDGGTTPQPSVLLQNGDFNQDASAWLPRADVAQVAFDAGDSASGAGSGSALVTVFFVDAALRGSQVQGGVSQCAAVNPGSGFQFTARYRLDAAAPSSAGVALRASLYTANDCTGSQVGVIQGPLGSVRGAWTDLFTSAFDVSAQVHSVRVFAELRKDFADPQAVAAVDHLVLAPGGGEARCGDGVLSPGEACDPGLLSNCTPDCKLMAVCGDGMISPPEECDPPNTASCGPQCFRVRGFCGNGVIEPGEQCDPPNGTTCGLSCSSIRCGDSVVSPPEECDSQDRSICTAGCRRVVATCGDRVVQGNEQCDPPNALTECSADCRTTKAVCGNGTVEGTEQCDPPDAAKRCGSDCHRLPWCGDGRIEGNEACDPPDGTVCDTNCQVLAGMQCEGCLAQECRGTDPSSGPFADCFSAAGVAESGPAVGQARSALCAEAVECMATTGCAQEGVLTCYCGRGILGADGRPDPERFQACALGLSAAEGVCKDPFERAGESLARDTIVSRVSLPGPTALSAATALLRCGVPADADVLGASPVAPRCNVTGKCRVTASCGNSIVEPGEECDDGNADALKCDAQCKSVRCGNGVVDPGEDCDTKDPFTQSRCQPNCTLITDCGDGCREGAEECDPGEPKSYCPAPPAVPPSAVCCPKNPPPGSPCTAADTCKFFRRCGNGKVEYPEACDPPDGKTCSETCTVIATSPCDLCTEKNCNGDGYVDQCKNDPTLSPGCRAVDACIARTKCNASNDLACFCGTQDALTTCQSQGGNGACKDEIDAALANLQDVRCTQSVAPALVPQCIATRLGDPNYGGGVRFQIALCQRDSCATECGLIH